MKFADAKVGDSVAIPTSGGDVLHAVIERLTPTQVVVGGERYSRDNGHKVGKANGYITPWTPDHDVQRKRYAAGQRLALACDSLRKVAVGWGVVLPKDIAAATNLANAIEAYVEAAK